MQIFNFSILSMSASMHPRQWATTIFLKKNNKKVYFKDTKLLKFNPTTYWT